jgi:hypothetical protein
MGVVRVIGGRHLLGTVGARAEIMVFSSGGTYEVHTLQFIASSAFNNFDILVIVKTISLQEFFTAVIRFYPPLGNK